MPVDRSIQRLRRIGKAGACSGKIAAVIEDRVAGLLRFRYRHRQPASVLS